ncbi:MAG: type II toxin-antitoxin system HicA family toxin [Candidatus Diapherotrites archaeon]|nr:type II toxin-antitoxin system HicA family toxin [Candidatus Diapherotrites archaeon]
MIPKSVSGKELIKILLKKGYWVRSQKGSHVHLRHPINSPLTVPVHKGIAIGTLKAIIKAAELKEEDFE